MSRRGAQQAKPGNKLQQLVGEWIQPPTSRTAEEIIQYGAEMEEMEAAAVSWTVKGEWLLELPRPISQPQLVMKKEDMTFWPTYQWNDNPWIVDKKGRMLTAQKFEKIKACTLEQLNIIRVAETTYAFKIPMEGEKQHQQAKLRRWALAIQLNAPRVEIGGRLQVSTNLRMRHVMHLANEYGWEVTGPGRATGTMVNKRDGGDHTIVVEQQPNGVQWRVREQDTQDPVTEADTKRMQRNQQEGSIVFFAHPRIHGFPWRVKDSIANKHILQVLKKQPYAKYKGEGREIRKLLYGLEERIRTSEWQRAAMAQTPKQLWEHNHELTEYQVWVVYRIAVRQLNLYYEGKEHEHGCRKLEACKDNKETMEHIFWECPCAQECWKKLIQQWTGEKWNQEGLQGFQLQCASRRAPGLSSVQRERIRAYTPDEEKETIAVWNRIWRILASVCVTSLWIQRNRVVFHQEEVTAESSAQEFWATGMSQLRALAKRERRMPDKQIQGTRLYLCQQELERKPREQSPQVMGPVQPPDQDQAPALLTRLRKYQTSSRH